MESSPVRVGVAGVGFGAAVHIPAFQSEGVDVVAICSRRRERAEEAATRFGIERSRPMPVVPLDEKQLAAAAPPAASFLRVEPSDVIVTSLKPSRDGKALMLRLFNPGRRAKKATVRWASGPKEMFVSGPDEVPGKAFSGPVELPGQGILTLRCAKRKRGS